MHLFPRNGHFALLPLLMGGDCFYRLAQPCGFQSIFLYHYFWPFFVVPYSSPPPHTHVSRRPLHTYPGTPYQHDPHPILVQRHQGPTPTTRSQTAGLQLNSIPLFPIKCIASVPTRVLRQQHYVGTSSPPDNFKIFCCVTPTSRSLARLVALQG